MSVDQAAAEALGRPRMNAADWLALQVRRAGEWANPILVKETRQALKSRQFVSTFLLLLLASWVASVVGVVWFGEAMEYGRAGRDFFAMFYAVLAVAILVVVPFGAFRSLLGERDENTWELLSITALTPRQIVWGKLLSALLQVFIYYSAIAPFIAFTSLLQGFDLAQVTYLLALLLVVSLGYSMTALMLSTQARHKHTQVFATLGMFALVGNGFFGFLTIVFSTMAFAAFDNRDFWLANAIGLLVFISYFILFLQIATANLTFESDNRSTGIRITLAAQFWLFWIVGIGLFHYFFPGRGIDAESIVVMVTICTIHWIVAGLVASTESNALSRRIRRGLPRRGWRRLLLAPFLPGGSRGYLYATIHIVALWAIVVFLVPRLLPVAPFYATRSPTVSVPVSVLGPKFAWLGELGVLTTVLCCYMLIYLGLATLLSRAGQRVASDIKPGHTRFVTVLIAFLVLLVPLVGRLLKWVRFQEYVAADLLNPVTTIGEVVAGAASIRWIVPTLATVALVAVLVNLRAMWRGVAEVIFESLPAASPDGALFASAASASPADSAMEVHP